MYQTLCREKKTTINKTRNGRRKHAVTKPN